MIDFVLDAAGEEAVAFEDVRSAVRILKFDSNRIAALYISPDFGKGEAALFIGQIRALEKFDFGIYESHRHDQFERRPAAVELIIEIGFAFRHIDDAELQIASNLLGGKADAVRLPHCVNHLFDEFAKLLIEGRDFLAFCP